MKINKRTAPGSCMVVGCTRKAIYRNAQRPRSRYFRGVERGYCSIHRDLAFSHANVTIAKQEDRLAALADAAETTRDNMERRAPSAEDERRRPARFVPAPTKGRS